MKTASFYKRQDQKIDEAVAAMTEMPMWCGSKTEMRLSKGGRK